MPSHFEPQNSPTLQQTWQLPLKQTLGFLPVAPPVAAFSTLKETPRETLFRELGYTFWNQELLDGLAARLQAEQIQHWLEIAAGTGIWTLELCRRGLHAVATDNYSQAPERVRSFQRPIHYGDWVLPLSAQDAVAHFRPEGILCAWPPLGSALLFHLLAREYPGSESLRLMVCIGDPHGPSELPSADALPPGWETESWPECETFLLGFNDPSEVGSSGSHSRLLIYRHRA